MVAGRMDVENKRERKNEAQLFMEQRERKRQDYIERKDNSGRSRVSHPESEADYQCRD
jgi:hypothetical protein